MAYSSAAQKAKAIKLIEGAIAQFEKHRCMPDAWQSACLIEGLSALRRGAYGLAVTEARDVYTPKAERGHQPEQKIKPLAIAVLKKAVSYVKQEPLRDHSYLRVASN
jgi:hypothetical protein